MLDPAIVPVSCVLLGWLLSHVNRLWGNKDAVKMARIVRRSNQLDAAATKGLYLAKRLLDEIRLLAEEHRKQLAKCTADVSQAAEHTRDRTQELSDWLDASLYLITIQSSDATELAHSAVGATTDVLVSISNNSFSEKNQQTLASAEEYLGNLIEELILAAASDHRHLSKQYKKVHTAAENARKMRLIKGKSSEPTSGNEPRRITPSA